MKVAWREHEKCGGLVNLYRIDGPLHYTGFGLRKRISTAACIETAVGRGDTTMVVEPTPTYLSKVEWVRLHGEMKCAPGCEYTQSEHQAAWVRLGWGWVPTICRCVTPHYLNTLERA